MAIYDDQWFEIWYEQGVSVLPGHILVVSYDRETHEAIIVDPFKSFSVIHRAKTYEDVCTWLWEDEYSLVEGRMFPDDGWGS
jgi:hypothetical protein